MSSPIVDNITIVRPFQDSYGDMTEVEITFSSGQWSAAISEYVNVHALADQAESTLRWVDAPTNSQSAITGHLAQEATPRFSLRFFRARSNVHSNCELQLASDVASLRIDLRADPQSVIRFALALKGLALGSRETAVLELRALRQ